MSYHRHEPPRVTLHAVAAIGLIALVGVLMPSEAQAYVGPGAGITAIGSLIALIAGLLFAIVGFVWFPIKRLRRRRKEKQMEEAAKQVGEAPKT